MNVLMRGLSLKSCIEVLSQLNIVFISNELYINYNIYVKVSSMFCWALLPQGQGLLHWIQLLEVLPYENRFHIMWTSFFGESV